ncbi:alpha/beta hydrolase domain-containing protein [Haliangium sp.]|uniref:alpha/beta hydrolase domain-containing protein n=1 Tax=Haliangium sp. TaxID=2663208 RepID=UPI003D0DA1BC
MRAWPILVSAVTVTASLAPAGARAEVVRVDVTSRAVLAAAEQPGFDRDYEKLAGTVHFAFAPDSPANRAVVDLGLAPRGRDGRVEAHADFMVLQPRRPEDRRGVALLEVSNRGGKASLRYFMAAERFSADPAAPEDFGDGLLMRLGLTIIWVGWQFDVPAEPDRLRLHVPVARAKRTRRRPQGEPIRGLVRSDWVVDTPAQVLPLSHREHWTYPVADPADPRNQLTRRRGREAAREPVPRSDWRFAPDGAHIQAPGGFAPGYIYELVYVSQDPRVVGLGLAAVRDMMSHAKYDPKSPFPVRLGVGFGVSQTGRFLRHFLYQGFNVDEQGRKVFDGLLIHTAGAGRGSFNHRFGQPSRDAHRYSAFFYPTDLFPFTSQTQADPVTAQRDGLLAHLPEQARPKIMYTNTGYEYWGRAAALIHISPDGARDVAPLPNERIYHLASGQHFVDRWPPADEARLPGAAAWRANPLDYLVNLRALLVGLVAWVEGDAQPPASRYPRLADGTLVPVDELALPRMPGISAPTAAHVAYRADYGPEWPRGIVTRQPPALGPPFPALVPQIDRCGNERAGVRNLEIQVPVATYLSWQLRQGLPQPGELADFRGMFVPLPRSLDAAQAAGDARPPLNRLYPRPEVYDHRVERALTRLIRAGFVLAEDRERVRAQNQDRRRFVYGVQ